MPFTTRITLLALAVTLLTGGCQTLAPKTTPELIQTPVFTAGTEGYHTFRIPALIATQQGTLLAFCEGRKNSRSDHGDLDLVLKRSTDGGSTWGPLQLVYEEGGDADITIGNPCPVVDQNTGIIWLPFCRNNDRVFITKSQDDGLTWACPVEITADVKPKGWGWYATGPGVGIQLRRGPHKGRLVIPCDHREPFGGQEVMASHVFYSDDAGATWHIGGSVSPHTDECQVVELADGRLMMNMRNYWARTAQQPANGGMRAAAWSTDGGEWWSPLRFEHALPEPVCQASFLRYSRDPNRLIFSNPGHPGKRIKMTIRMSLDEGETWPIARVLHQGPSAYSCLTALPNGPIACLYECGKKGSYETITFARFPLAWLTGASP